MNYSDQELSENLREGDQAALKHLFDVYARGLVIHSMKMVGNQGVAEEIVQDVFIELWKNRSSFRLEKNFRSYLFSSVRNRSINYLKSSYGRMRFDSLDQAVPEKSGSQADSEIHMEDLRKVIAKAIERLPFNCRVIFNLSRNAGMSIREIAIELNLSEKTVHAQIAIAVRKIREDLGDKQDIL